MKKKAVAIVDENEPGEERYTQRVLKTLDPATRRAAASLFVGWTVVFERQVVSGGSIDEVEAYVEGTASVWSGSFSDALIVTIKPRTHDLNDMHVVPLSTIRSIKTIRQGGA